MILVRSHRDGRVSATDIKVREADLLLINYVILRPLPNSNALNTMVVMFTSESGGFVVTVVLGDRTVCISSLITHPVPSSRLYPRSPAGAYFEVARPCLRLDRGLLERSTKSNS